MVPEDVALKLTGFVNMAFTMGMLFFPDKLMETYDADAFSGDAGVVFKFSMGIFGLSQLYAGMLNIGGSKPHVSQTEKSTQCLCNVISWGTFVLLDGRMLVGLLERPDAIPRDAVVKNMYLFSALTVINLLGWITSNRTIPPLDRAYKGSLSLPAWINTANTAFFGLGMAFATEMFVNMYIPGVLDRIDVVKAKPMILIILANTGKGILLNIMTSLANAAASPDPVKTTYRLTRIAVYLNMFFSGMISREHILADAAGWPLPMHTMHAIQAFALTFYLASSYASVPISLKRLKKTD